MIKKYIYLSGAILVTVFIFSNSTLPASESSAMSRGLLAVINDLLPLEISHHLLRKMAHFSEFFLQSFFLVQFIRSFYAYRKSAVITALCGFLTACCDEFIQNFSDGRATRFSDVLIDFSGTLCALFAVGITIYLLTHKTGARTE